MSSQSSGSKRKRTDRSNLGNLLHPGEWRTKRARSGSPSASGASTPGMGSHSPAQSNASSRGPSPVGHPGPSVPTTTSSSTRNATGGPWTGLEKALRALHLTAGMCPPLSMAVDELVSCLPEFKAAAENRKDYDELSTGLERMVEQLDRHLKQTTSEGIMDTITGVAEAIRKEIESIDVKKPGSLPLGRRMEAASSADDDLMRRYRRIEQLFRQLQGEASMSTWNTVDELRVDQHLKDLDPAKLAKFDSKLSTDVSRRGCTKHTRTTILEGSIAWSDNAELAKIYWMNGMAGTGKTTIAYSLCERLEAGKQLAASFFCTRASPECREAKRIIPTIAYQLARRFTPFRYSLCQQLKKDPDASSNQLSSQFDLLLKQPLLAAKDKLSNNLVIVIDALDECSDPHIVELFLSLLFRSVMELPVKFFVTSRPEPAIRNKMKPESERTRSILYLHEIERSLVQADIELYLREELESIAPADDDITELAGHAGNLFIYAATAVRYIRPADVAVNSKARLKAILTISAESQKKLPTIDALYTAILTAAINHPELESEEQRQRRLVLWTAVCTCEPVLIRTLSILSGLDSKDDTMAALQPLRSVLHVSEHSELVTTLHASFPDYMFSHDRSGAFYCDRPTHSQLLAEQCFKIMKAQLRFNICSIQSSFIPNQKIPDIGERVIANISEELFYSCQFWVDHLSDAGCPDAPLLWTHDFLRHRLLFWMEVMSLKNCMVNGTMIMIKLNTWLSQALIHQHPGKSINILELASDAQAFVAMYASSPASAFTPHIYISALPLSPPSSPVRLGYLAHFKGLIKVSGSILEEIGRFTFGSWASTTSIRSATFSPGGDLVVLGDERGRISVQNTYDGNYVVQPFKAHKKLVASLAVSSDGMQIVSGSHDMTLSVWNIHDGSLISGPYKGHTNRVTSVAFSLDAVYIASGSDDCTVGIWTPRNPTVSMRSFTGHEQGVNSVSFSPNGSHLISGSTDHTIRVWDLLSGTVVFTLEGYSTSVTSVQFSLDGDYAISGYHGSTVRIWSTHDGSLSRELKGHDRGITSTIMSPNGRHVVSGSLDFTIRVWDMHTGELVAGPFKGHTGLVRSVGISNDGTRVMSASNDKTVRVWNVQGQAPQSSTRKYVTIFEAAAPNQTRIAIYEPKQPNIHVWDLRTMKCVTILTSAYPRAIRFSSDSTRIHSVHNPGTLCTWDAQTAELLDGPHHWSPPEKWREVACSADGTRLLFYGTNKTTLWHAQSNQSTNIRPPFKLYHGTFSQDGSKLLTSGFSVHSESMSEVRDGHSGALVAGPFQAWGISLSLDGTYLCCNYNSDDKNTIYELLNTENGEKSPMKLDSFPTFTWDCGPEPAEVHKSGLSRKRA
ncbi:unnamed protein product, partial [Rhizoctonia solani]